MASSQFQSGFPRNSGSIDIVVYSIPDVMTVLNISRQTVYDEINSGRLRSFKVKARRLVSANAISEYIREREEETNPSATQVA
jgi:excisionase family DNA binding protein